MSGTKELLLAAAERLFAERGFAGVGIREIARAAGANTAAVNYHFESKLNLWLEILRRRTAPIDGERFRRLDAARSQAQQMGQRLCVKALTDALICPLIDELVDADGAPDTFRIRLMVRLHVETPMLFREDHLEFFADARERFAEAMEECFPGRPVKEIYARLFYLSSAMVGLLVHAETLVVAKSFFADESFRAVLDACVARSAAAVEGAVFTEGSLAV
ncbi:MAG: TetR family transcriptional regulator [Opitutales bacterium]|nr:TetR family transcriptional regulator [Opitutales bacterium]